MKIKTKRKSKKKMLINKKAFLFMMTIIVVTSFSSCLKDRKFPVPNSPQTGTLVINELMAYETLSYGDEFGGSATAEDWIEIYNETDSAITFGNRWFLSDTVGTLNKWQFPSKLQGQPIILPSKGYLLVYCDNLVSPYIVSDSLGNQLHASFRLAHTSGAVVLSYAANGGNPKIVDSYIYGNQPTKDISFGRLPNGGSNWSFCTQATPGAANQ